MADLSALSRTPGLLQRIGVTLAALAIYRIGCWIPLPGIEIGALADQGMPGALGSMFERVSIMALGIVPLLSALILVELAMIAWPHLRAQASNPQSRERLDYWTALGALFIAAAQGHGIAVMLESIAGLVPAPGLAFRAGVVVSFVAVTAVVIWLASVITRYGVGSGFWIFVAAPHAISFSETLLAQAATWGEASIPTIMLSIAFLALCVAVLAALTKSAPPLAEPTELAWAPVLGFTVANWMLAGLLLLRWLLLPSAEMGAFDRILLSQGTTLLPIVAIVVVVILRRRSLAARPANAIVTSAVPLALALTGLAVLGDMLSTLANVPLFPTIATPLILAAVGIVIIEGSARHEAISPLPPSHSTS